MAKKIKAKKIHQKPLTVDDLAKYNQKILFPALDDKFAKIDDKFAKIDDSFEKVGDRFNKIDDRFDKTDGEIEEKFNKIMDGQDKILKIIEDLKTEQTMDVAVHKRQDGKLENHETRIKIVENKLGVAAARWAG